MWEKNPHLPPAKIRNTRQRPAPLLPPYYLHEVGAGMLNAQAAVLEAAFSQRRFGGWRGAAYQGQVTFVSNSQTLNGSAAPGSNSDSSLNIPANTLLASVQVAWGGVANPTSLNLS